MPKKVPQHSVITVRNGKLVHVKPGEAFDFTKEELDHLHNTHGKHFTKPHTVEVAEEAEEHGDDGADAGLTESPAAKPAAKPKAVVAGKGKGGTSQGL